MVSLAENAYGQKKLDFRVFWEIHLKECFRIAIRFVNKKFLFPKLFKQVYYGPILIDQRIEN
ncbi:hypothetical protein BpHYR1_023234 [Brachionus plicatilis]|uniref:Uncharacterized protein n=1 Tax=Brachionus plicatilis TaxID=10195 RepID=A0A3M7SSU7_BRAPC|nr:hypothetical protein BpHYR1_023234 [Brachionus plicatilis]